MKLTCLFLFWYLLAVAGQVALKSRVRTAGAKLHEQSSLWGTAEDTLPFEGPVGHSNFLLLGAED